ncbi:hypothetical protein F5Y04DRAFT_123935 [Hypomontagnella monticulosa]|nr:hypothetical protein F5Y04DRAFT_123935 [Hypomontagnella monticulosa]
MVRFNLLQLLTTCASAAYVQWQHCDDYTPDLHRLVPGSLSATLEHVNNTHDRLSLTIRRGVEKDECTRWASETTTADLDLDMLGYSSSHNSTVETTCHEFTRVANQSMLTLGIAQDVDAFHPLSTFHTTLRLVGPDVDKACLQANITPQFSAGVQAMLRYAPLGILAFVFLVGVARSIGESSASTETSPRAVLPGFADCLQYLQFIFLSGSLSLFYPGFYQPAMSRLGWLSLFSDGLISHGTSYSGVKDGIYELNGTYGGTFGLELMTQVSGSPMTMDTWLNMVILILCIAAFSALCLEVYWLVNRPTGSDTGLRRTFTRTLHIVLSYFMLPLIALSFYQLDNASYLPAYHTFLAIFLIVIIFSAFGWLLLQIPTRTLGVLIFDNRKRYEQIASPETSGSKHQSFVLSLFVLVFIRGAAIGGLQISGKAQLAVLGACELVLLACIIQFQAYSTFSIGSTTAVARLVSLLCMVAFVRGVASDNVRSVVGYIVLLIHTFVLVIGFCVPTIIHLGRLSARWWNRPSPSVYGLRQLRRRRVLRTQLPDRPSTNDRSPDSYTDQGSALPPGASPQPHGARSSHFDSSSVSSRNYYRPPRPSSVSPDQSSNHRRAQLSTASLITSFPEPPRISPSIDSHSTERSESSCETVSSDSLQSDSAQSETLANTTDTSSLHPRWADYSFRESDLFYGVPKPQEEGTTIGAPMSTPSRSSMRSTSTLSLWTRFSGQPSTTERGFSVARRTPPPNLNPP